MQAETLTGKAGGGCWEASEVAPKPWECCMSLGVWVSGLGFRGLGFRV